MDRASPYGASSPKFDSCDIKMFYRLLGIRRYEINGASHDKLIWHLKVGKNPSSLSHSINGRT